ncbi:hypothetical protein IAR55_005527 [Kwoniella newhampshirensis]|uniref:F-box domain-containing protein n=1 Tax=Kwoniella newhampshirensis TaxID=1651941 RepID=A0AAW0YZB4_9TREE
MSSIETASSTRSQHLQITSSDHRSSSPTFQLTDIRRLLEVHHIILDILVRDHPVVMRPISRAFYHDLRHIVYRDLYLKKTTVDQILSGLEGEPKGSLLPHTRSITIKDFVGGQTLIKRLKEQDAPGQTFHFANANHVRFGWALIDIPNSSPPIDVSQPRYPGFYKLVTGLRGHVHPDQFTFEIPISLFEGDDTTLTSCGLDPSSFLGILFRLAGDTPLRKISIDYVAVEEGRTVVRRRQSLEIDRNHGPEYTVEGPDPVMIELFLVTILNSPRPPTIDLESIWKRMLSDWRWDEVRRCCPQVNEWDWNRRKRYLVTDEKVDRKTEPLQDQ